MSATSTPQDDDRTAMPGLATAPLAGHPPAAATANSLPPGTRLDEFEITGLVGVGGFGIVYLAQDHSLGRRVAIKEYMPNALAARTGATTVSVKSPRYAETFATGLRSFINEARLLARFDHPSLLKVYRFWEANGTAYMAMPYYEGSTLKEVLQRLGGPPEEQWLKDLLRPLLDALARMHRERCFHRDISPDNILVLADGRPVLLDFGAARRVIGDVNQALTVILKSGYAPVEQYGETTGVPQGAWTDLYALAAVVYFAITGETPVASVSRMMSDTLVPLAKRATGRYDDRFLRGIDRALAVRAEDRPQDVAEMRVALGLGDRRQQVRASIPDVAANVTADVVASPAAKVAVETRAPTSTAPAATTTATAPAVSETTAKPAVPRVTGNRTIYVAAAIALVGVIGAIVAGILTLPKTKAPEAVTMAKPTVEAPPVQPPAPAAGLLPPSAPSVPSAPTLPPEVERSAAAPNSFAGAKVQSEAASAGAAAAEPGGGSQRVPAIVEAPEKAAAIARSQPAPRTGAQAERCSDLLQRKSLGEPLTDEEQVTLRKDC